MNDEKNIFLGIENFCQIFWSCAKEKHVDANIIANNETIYFFILEQI